MRFRTYQGMRPGIQQVMAAIAAPGGAQQDAYNQTMRDMAYVDSADANIRHSNSETALNTDQLNARSAMKGELEKIATTLPPNLTPGVISSVMRAGNNPTLQDLTGGIRDMNGSPLQMEAAQHARTGNTATMNALIGIDAGKPYTPYTANEQGLLDTGAGTLAPTPGSQAKVSALNAQAGASNAAAGASNALAQQRQFMEVSPGASLYDINQRGSAQPSATMAALEGMSMLPPGVAGTMPDGRPIIRNPDGSVSTHEMSTVTDPRLNGGQATLLPTIVNGQRMSEQGALKQALAAGGVDPTTGQPLASYASPEEAETDYLLRQHPQIDRESSWRAQQGTQAPKSAIRGALDSIPQPSGGPRFVATAPSNPGTEKLVEVYDPNSPTGTSFVRQSDAIGRAGKPGSKGVSITYDEQGRPIVEMGGRADLTTTARNATDTKLLETGDTLSQLTAIRSRFKPEYQQIGTRWNALVTSAKSKAGIQIANSERQALRDFAKYRAESGQMFSNILKTLSGAAVTPAEMKRAEGWLPNPGTGLLDGDDPETLAAKVDRMEDFTRKALSKYAYVKRHGLDIGAIDVDQMPMLMQQRGDEIASELQGQGIPPAELARAVKLRLADEFGLGAY